MGRRLRSGRSDVLGPQDVGRPQNSHRFESKISLSLFRDALIQGPESRWVSEVHHDPASGSNRSLLRVNGEWRDAVGLDRGVRVDSGKERLWYSTDRRRPVSLHEETARQRFEVIDPHLAHKPSSRSQIRPTPPHSPYGSLRGRAKSKQRSTSVFVTYVTIPVPGTSV